MAIKDEALPTEDILEDESERRKKNEESSLISYMRAFHGALNSPRVSPNYMDAFIMPLMQINDDSRYQEYAAAKEADRDMAMHATGSTVLPNAHHVTEQLDSTQIDNTSDFGGFGDFGFGGGGEGGSSGGGGESHN